MSQEATATTFQQIEQIIQRHVRPYIEMDGGEIELVRYEESIAYVRLSGACDTCPSAQLTLKGGIERQIVRRLPEVRAVVLEMEEEAE